MKTTSVVNKTRLAGLILGLLGFLIPYLVTFPGLTFAGHVALSIFLLAAVFWMMEPIPIYATSLMVIFLGVLLLSGQGPMFKDAEVSVTKVIQIDDNLYEIPTSSVTVGNEVYVRNGTKWEKVAVSIQSTSADKAVVTSTVPLDEILIATNINHKLTGYTPGRSADYMGTLANPIIILFLGGFMIAEAAVKYNFDKNLTRYLLRPFGTKPSGILIGLMLITAALSAFMSNTATTAMMMTVIIPIMSQMEKGDRFKAALALSVPIAANLGGISTPIGTPPNAIVIANLQLQGISISFTEWMLLTIPLVIIVLGVAWFMLIKFFPSTIKEFKTADATGFNKSPKAIVFYFIFGITLILWVTESLHGISSNIVALLPISALAITEVLDVNDIRKLPWEVLWLVAGGLALGVYLDQTGLADYMVRSIDWGSFTGFMVIALFGFVAILLSNFLSNTVAATLLMPLAISIGILQGSGELELMELALVIGVGTSLAMVLPISTPPNAIAIATGMVKTSEMAKTGVVIGVVGLIIMLIYAVVYWPLLLN